MDKYCLSTQDRSILRCPQKKAGEKYCKRHEEIRREFDVFYDYDGSSYQDNKRIKPSNPVWIFINQMYKEKKSSMT